MTKECNVYAKTVCKTKFFLSQGRSLKGSAISALTADPHVPFKELRLTQKQCYVIIFLSGWMLCFLAPTGALLYMHIQKQQLFEILSFYTSIYSCNFEHCNDVGLMFKINVHRSTYVW